MHFRTRGAATAPARACLAALLALGAGAAHAQTDITGVHTGANASDRSGNSADASGGTLYGYGGGSGASAGTGAVTVHGATLTGGNSGRITGLSISPADDVQGAQGGFGLSVYAFPVSATSLTASGSAFQGGRGGDAAGTGKNQVQAGVGGTGLYANALSVTITDGTFTGGAGGTASGTAPLVLGGLGGDGAMIDNSTHAVITGGAFQGGDGGTASGGDRAGFVVAGTGGSGLFIANSTVSVYGGTFHHGADLNPGGSFGDFLGNSSVITLYGSDFTVGGVNNFYGVVDPTGSGAGSFSGLLADNSAAATYTYNLNGATIILAPTPEPSAFAALGLGVLGLGGLALKARKRKALTA